MSLIENKELVAALANLTEYKNNFIKFGEIVRCCSIVKQNRLHIHNHFPE
ncbi:hypothetical protein PRJ_Fausto_00490 [Faustovirus]|nr:hypothetical protein PRJ_Fausto_00490 [Faustovirus]